ncbi:MAG TPA: CPXCG motif-containing cysteine-rich protein [Gemmatimonadales bacterium]
MIDQPDSLEEEFPLGDGTADGEATVACPHCGEVNILTLDPGGGAAQEYVEDCQVCCRPWRVVVRYGLDGGAAVSAEPL